MKTTLGNFLTQPNNDFPVDAETFDTLQQNQAILAVLGNIAGDKAVLLGCEPEQGGSARQPGYVFLRTREFPEGEILYWEGGSVSAGMYLKKEAAAVSAQGYEVPQAYTVRSLAPGIGEENYAWTEMRDIPTIQQQELTIAALRAELALLMPPPLGIVQIWAGAKVPDNYELCDGRELKIADYQELYEALGTRFNESYDCNGRRYATTSGYFRLPDLRGRFVVGYNASDTDYGSYGKVGGEKTHRLSVGEMPSHTHPVKDYYFSENFDEPGCSGREKLSSPTIGSKRTDHDNHFLYYRTHNTEPGGGNAAHENRPPYYALAYIIRIK